jgi:hypothetical protein
VTGDENLHLIREIEANRAFLLMAYQQNPALAARAEPRIRALLSPLPEALPVPHAPLAGTRSP